MAKTTTKAKTAAASAGDPLMKLVDLTGPIAADVSTYQAKIDSGETEAVSGVVGNMHMLLTTEGGRVLVVSVPLQNGPSVPVDPANPNGPQKYGIPTWGPCQPELRASAYHDPYQPGTKMANEAGTEFVWVQDKGFQPTGETTTPGAPLPVPGPAVVNIHGTDVQIDWSDRNGQSGTAVSQKVNADTSLFSFYSPNNIEVVVSIVGPINGMSLIKVGSLTAEAFRLTAKKGSAVKTLEQRQDAPLGAITPGFPE